MKMEKVLWDQNFWVVFMWVNREYHCVLVHFLYLLIVNLNKNYCLTFYTLFWVEELKHAPCTHSCTSKICSLGIFIQFFCPANHYFGVPSSQIYAWLKSEKGEIRVRF